MLSRIELANRKSSLGYGGGRVPFEHELLGAKQEGRKVTKSFFYLMRERTHTDCREPQPLPRKGMSKG